jgi:hypothetical protein
MTTRESQALVRSAFQLARELGIATLVVQADERRGVQDVDRIRTTERIVWLTRDERAAPLTKRAADAVIRLPESTLTRLSQLKIGMLEATMSGAVGPDERVVCLSGVAGSARLDTLLLANPQRDLPWPDRHHLERMRRLGGHRHVARLLDIALRLAAEGREGRSVGTIFVLGDGEALAPHLRQLVLNPLQGHARRKRTIHRPEFFETLRELAALDGAFVVDDLGVVVSAGTYLDAPVRRTRLRHGYGARHAAAQAVTAVANAISIVVSASSSTVTLFHEGATILELERPEPSGR